MATLRRDARALVDAVRASGSRVIKKFDADDDGVCVSMTLERGHTSNLTLIFEVRTPPMAPNHSSFLGLDARILARVAVDTIAVVTTTGDEIIV